MYNFTIHSVTLETCITSQTRCFNTSSWLYRYRNMKFLENNELQYDQLIHSSHLYLSEILFSRIWKFLYATINPSLLYFHDDCKTICPHVSFYSLPEFPLFVSQLTKDCTKTILLDPKYRTIRRV